MENSFHFFPLWKRGMKGDLTAFQKAKLLQSFFISPRGRGRKNRFEAWAQGQGLKLSFFGS